MIDDLGMDGWMVEMSLFGFPSWHLYVCIWVG